MDLFADFRERTAVLLERLKVSGELAPTVDTARIVTGSSRPTTSEDCDVVIDTSALRAGHAGEVAERLARHFASDPDVETATVVAGFVNVVLQPRYLGSVLASVLSSEATAGGVAAKPPMDVTPGRSAPPRDGFDPDRVGVVANAIRALLAYVGHPVSMQRDDIWPVAGPGEPARIRIRANVDDRLEPKGERARTLVVKPCHLLERDGSFGSASTLHLDAESDLPPEARDALRFAMLSQRSDVAITLDLDRITDRSHAAPLFDLCYAHARVSVVLRNVRASWPELDVSPAALARADFTLLTDPGERAVLLTLAKFPHVVALAAERCEPHRLAQLLRDLAGAVHRQWNTSKDQPQKRFVNEEQRDLTEARLGLMTASALVLTSGLGIFGIKTPDEMR